jgi:hypothetical protein
MIEKKLTAEEVEQHFREAKEKGGGCSLEEYCESLRQAIVNEVKPPVQE